MRYVRHGPPGHEKPGAVDVRGAVRDLSALVGDIAPGFFPLLKRIDARTLDALPVVKVGTRLGPCVAGASKVVGIGLNYVDHATEAGFPIPDEPVVFLKAASALSGPNDPVVLPPASSAVDWEIELGVVIGEPARYVTVQEAQRHILGYCIVNDVSDRVLQMKNAAQWSNGKSFDTFAPIGPWLVTKDEIADPQNLWMRLTLNGRARQESTTSRMVFDVARLVSHVSGLMTLWPGDIICTGTPAGVGYGRTPKEYLRDGDALRLEIEGLGAQAYPVVAWEATQQGKVKQ